VTGVLISDEEYPVRPAFSLLAKALDEFATTVPTNSYSNPSSISFPQLQTYVAKYQDPKQADAIMKVQQELDATKIVLVGGSRTIRQITLAHKIQLPTHAAQDHRVSSPTWREARGFGRSIQ
jgi:hypothetical protein